MYGWEGKPFAQIERLTRRRDPQRYPVAAVTSDGESEVIEWFRNVAELQQYLVRMEPQRWGVEGGTLIELKTELERALTPLSVAGLAPALREAYNNALDGRFRIIWWGTLEELVEGGTGWPASVLRAAGAEGLNDDDRRVRVLEWLASHRPE
ncbi:hypothetical protein ACEZHJ_04775 [Arhodomonas sp. KWT2]